MPDTPGQVLAMVREIHTTALASGTPLQCVMEQVSGYAGGAGQPGSAMFTFGRGFGFLEGILMAEGVSVEMVTPQRWMKALGLGTRGELSKAEWKRKLRAVAERLYPAQKVTLATADALLILHYARRAPAVPAMENRPETAGRKARKITKQEGVRHEL